MSVCARMCTYMCVCVCIYIYIYIQCVILKQCTETRQYRNIPCQLSIWNDL